MSSDHLRMLEMSAILNPASPEPVNPYAADRAPADMPFRFLDLPRELRDAIYKELLQLKPSWKLISTNGNKPQWIYGEHRHGYPDTQILRVNRKVYGEARLVFLQENLFIRFTTTIILVKVTHHLFRAAKLLGEREKGLRFKGFVATYSVLHEESREKRTADERLAEAATNFQCLVPLGMLHLLCKKIVGDAWETPNYHTKFSHWVQLHGAYSNSTERGSTECLDLYSAMVQKKVLSEFRLAFKELFPNFKVRGNVPATLLDETIADIAVVKPRDPIKVIAGLESLKQHSKELYREKQYRLAGDKCTELEIEIKKLYQTFIGDEVAKVGGQIFRNELAQRRFENLLRKVKYFVKFLQENEAKSTFDRKVANNLISTIICAWKYLQALAARVNSSTWFPSIPQGTKLSLLSAVGYRLTGQADARESREKACLEVAEKYIVKAQGMAPGDITIQTEYDLIAAWKMTVLERNRSQQQTPNV